MIRTMQTKSIFQKTRKRIVVTSLEIVVGVLIIFAMVTSSIFNKNLYKKINQQLLTHKNMTINDMKIVSEGDKTIEVIMPVPLAQNLISFVWEEGRLIKGSPHPYEGEHQYPQFPDDEEDKVVTLHDGAHTYRGISFMNKGLNVQLLLKVDEEVARAHELKVTLIMAGCIVLFIVLGLGYYLATLTLKPLKLAYDKQVMFIQHASHEMRTPLAIMKGRLELLARHNHDTIEAHFEELSKMMEELRGLEKLNSDLFLMSKEEVGSKLELTTIEANEMIEGIYSFYQDYAEMQDKQMHITKAQKALQVYWDQVKVKRCISILIENALKYTHSGDEIYLSLAPKGEKSIQITVSDTGIGIKKEELPHIFDRFYRSGEVRAAGIEGSGIGLSLLEALAYAMGIKLKVESTYGKGTTFILDIPRKMK